MNTGTYLQIVRWKHTDDTGCGLWTWDEQNNQKTFIQWDVLRNEIEKNLFPQLFKYPSHFRVSTMDFGEKKDWLVRIFKNETPVFGMWFGGNPEKTFAFDGCIHIGNLIFPQSTEPGILHTYQRVSDGSYRRVCARVRCLDE